MMKTMMKRTGRGRRGIKVDEDGGMGGIVGEEDGETGGGGMRGE